MIMPAKNAVASSAVTGAKLVTVMAHSWRTTRRTFLSLSAGAGLSILASGGLSTLAAGGERRIFSSGRIGSLRLKNRLIRSATSENAFREGVMTDEGIAIYRALGQGGAGLIITGNMAAMAGGRYTDLQTCIYDDRFIPSIRRIAEAVHGAGNGCKVLAQITHTAPEGQLSDPIAASATPRPSWKRQPRAMTAQEVEEMTGQFAQAIRRAKTAGFDGVEIYAAGYLLGSFLSPYTNTRADRFGGSLENRVRVIADIISKAQKLVGGNFPILAKLNCDDGLEGGTNIDTFPAVAAQVEKAGVAAIDVIGPIGGRNLEPESYFLKYAQKLRVEVPVILTGGNRNVDRLEQILQAGPPDFVAMARPLIPEPDLPARRQTRQGAPDAACISCNRCLDGFRQGKITRCRVNDA
jgi:2,4-dienoyl-CoA reductase-like NADH-dependent reductase (Old Yellow Enzyme family)